MRTQDAAADPGGPPAGKDGRKRGLALEQVVLLGRTFEEYSRYFALAPQWLAGRRVLDVAGGVSSFGAEGRERGLDITACDPIYELAPGQIRLRCESDLEQVTASIGQVPTYKWDFYHSPERLRREYREPAYRRFLEDFAREKGRRYVPGRLPQLPFADRQFDLTLVSYLLFVYGDQFGYEFHRDSLREILRVTRGEARFYPLVTFEAVRSPYLERLQADEAFAGCRFEEVVTDFEFLLGSNRFLRVWREQRES